MFKRKKEDLTLKEAYHNKPLAFIFEIILLILFIAEYVMLTVSLIGTFLSETPDALEVSYTLLNAIYIVLVMVDCGVLLVFFGKNNIQNLFDDDSIRLIRESEFVSCLGLLISVAIVCFRAFGFTIGFDVYNLAVLTALSGIAFTSDYFLTDHIRKG